MLSVQTVFYRPAKGRGGGKGEGGRKGRGWRVKFNSEGKGGG